MKAVRQRIYDKYKGRCGYCGDYLKIKDMTIDHIIPKSIFIETILSKKNIPTFLKHLTTQDVSHIDNLMCCCKVCNAWKGTKHLNQFKKEITKSISYIRNDINFKIGVKYKLIIESEPDIKFFFEELQENKELYILSYASLIDERELQRIKDEDGLEVSSEYLIHNSIRQVIYNLRLRDIKNSENYKTLTFINKEKNNKKPITLIISFKKYNNIYFLNEGVLKVNLTNKYKQIINEEIEFNSKNNLLDIIKDLKNKINNNIGVL